MENKTCTKCKTNKPLNKFSKRQIAKSGYNSQCKECTRKYTKEHYSQNKKYYLEKAKRRENEILAFIKNIKDNSSCKICGEKENCCLDFHHQYGQKECEISIIARRKRWTNSKVVKEIKKCIILCSNCHRKLHAGIILI